MIRTIPLNKLVQSSRNVRKHSDAAADAELAASIAALGLLQNLIVRPGAKGSLVEKGGVDRPDFAAPIYPNMGPMTVPANAPPMFVAVAADDFLLMRQKGLPLLESYRAAGKPIEFHLFSAGGHGFGAGPKGSPAEGWLDLIHRWMRTQGFLK